jgi:hypothetical protein
MHVQGQCPCLAHDLLLVDIAVVVNEVPVVVATVVGTQAMPLINICVTVAVYNVEVRIKLQKSG